MRLRDYAIEQLAEMAIGDNSAFPYRSSSLITRFFDRCGLPFVHDGSTRKWWTVERLKELNLGPSHSPDLPSDDLLRVIAQTFDSDDFERDTKPREAALEHFNKLMAKQGLAAYFDDAGQCHVRNTGSGVHSAGMIAPTTRPLSADEIAQRLKVATYLDSAYEDDFTQNLLVPLFRRFGFHRVSAAGHTEKTLEYGKDLWMKYQLPTGHWLYFGAQVKRDKLDVKGDSINTNAATVLNQVRMAVDHPLFDPDTGRKVLIDHVFVISAGEITRAARNWLVEKLDLTQRRQIIFMDRGEFLDHSARILLDLKLDAVPTESNIDDIPF
jgi:hypothetical protein